MEEIYKQVLCLARESLVKYKEHPEILTDRSVDKSTNYTGFSDLSLPFIDEIIRLNEFVYTTGSTCRVSDIYFHIMWINFYLPAKLVDRLIGAVKLKQWSYIVANFKTKKYSVSTFKDANINMILQYSLNKWFINPLIAEPEYKPGDVHMYYPGADKYATNRDERLTEIIKSIHGLDDMEKIMKKLNDSDIDYLRNLKTTNPRAEEFKKIFWKEVDEVIDADIDFSYETNKIIEPLNKYIENGEILVFKIMNHKDPFSRSLFRELYEILKDLA